MTPVTPTPTPVEFIQAILTLVYGFQLFIVILCLLANDENDYFESKLDFIYWLIPIIPILVALLKAVKKLFNNFMDL